MTSPGLSNTVPAMQVVTWNVNSIKARLERVLTWIREHEPDVLCLQELKVEDDKFPRAEFSDAGYHCAVYGERAYNGVAIVSREEPSNVRQGLGDGVHDPQARLVRVNVGGVEVITAYVPNGKRVGTEDYRYKLKWLGRLRSMLDRDYDPDDPVILCGDFNVAVDEKDVSKPSGWAQSVLFHPQMRKALQEVLDWGLADTFRPHHPEGGIYSWWDYRGPMWRKDEGLKIDYVFATKSLVERCTAASVDKDERDPKRNAEVKPSDHAPVIAQIDWE